MRKEILSLGEHEATSDPRHTTVNSSTIASNNPSSESYQPLKRAEGEETPAPAAAHPPSRYTPLPCSSHSIMERSNAGFGSDFESGGSGATTNMMILGKSTDGSLRLYQSSYPKGTGIHETSQAQEEWGQKKACSDDLNAILDVFGKNTRPPKHAGLAEQVQRRGLWAGP